MVTATALGSTTDRQELRAVPTRRPDFPANPIEQRLRWADQSVMWQRIEWTLERADQPQRIADSPHRQSPTGPPNPRRGHAVRILTCKLTTHHVNALAVGGIYSLPMVVITRFD